MEDISAISRFLINDQNEKFLNCSMLCIITKVIIIIKNKKYFILAESYAHELPLLLKAFVYIIFDSWLIIF